MEPYRKGKEHPEQSYIKTSKKWESKHFGCSSLDNTEANKMFPTLASVFAKANI